MCTLVTPSQSHCDAPAAATGGTAPPSGAAGPAEMLWCLVRRWDAPAAEPAPAAPAGSKASEDKAAGGDGSSDGPSTAGPAPTVVGATTTVARLEWQPLAVLLSWTSSQCLNKEQVR